MAHTNDDREYAKEWNEKGLRYAKIENWEVAKRYFEKCIDADPDNGEYWNNLGLIYSNQWKFRESIPYLEKAVAYCPHVGQFWISLGHAYWGLGDIKKELQVYEKGLQIHPNYLDLWYNKGVCLLNSQRFIEAKECFKQVLILDPNERFAPLHIKDCEDKIEQYVIAGSIERDPSGNVKGTVLYWTLNKNISKCKEEGRE